MSSSIRFIWPNCSSLYCSPKSIQERREQVWICSNCNHGNRYIYVLSLSLSYMTYVSICHNRYPSQSQMVATIVNLPMFVSFCVRQVHIWQLNCVCQWPLSFSSILLLLLFSMPSYPFHLYFKCHTTEKHWLQYRFSLSMSLSLFNRLSMRSSSFWYLHGDMYIQGLLRQLLIHILIRLPLRTTHWHHVSRTISEMFVLWAYYMLVRSIFLFFTRFLCLIGYRLKHSICSFFPILAIGLPCAFMLWL